MNNNLEFENEDPSLNSIEDNHPRTNYGKGYYNEQKTKETCIYCNNKGYIENHIGSSKIDCFACLI